MAKPDFFYFIENFDKILFNIIKLKIENEIKSQNKKCEKFENALNKNKHCNQLKMEKKTNDMVLN